MNRIRRKDDIKRARQRLREHGLPHPGNVLDQKVALRAKKRHQRVLDDFGLAPRITLSIERRSSTEYARYWLAISKRRERRPSSEIGCRGEALPSTSVLLTDNLKLL